VQLPPFFFPPNGSAPKLVLAKQTLCFKSPREQALRRSIGWILSYNGPAPKLVLAKQTLCFKSPREQASRRSIGWILS